MYIYIYIHIFSKLIDLKPVVTPRDRLHLEHLVFLALLFHLLWPGRGVRLGAGDRQRSQRLQVSLWYDMFFHEKTYGIYI